MLLFAVWFTPRSALGTSCWVWWGMSDISVVVNNCECVSYEMQMAKTSAALAKLSEAKVPYFSVLTNPTMAGVMASYATLGDAILAEPKALIGFAGPRVIEQTVGEKLPEGFQRSDFLMEKGVLDMIVDRREMRNTISQLISTLTQKEIQED